MLSAIIRYIFLCIVLIISFLLIRKSQLKHKRRRLIAVFIVAIIMTTIFTLIPVENAFITFSSPESSYKYNHLGEVKLILDGEKTDFVVGYDDDTYIHTIIPKSNNRWKIGTALKTNIIIQKTYDEIKVKVYQYENTSDYFITVSDIHFSLLDITDNRNSEFKSLENPISALDKTFYTYYAYIKDFDNQYILTVNGKPIKIQH